MNQFQQAVKNWDVTGTIENIKHTLHNVTKNFKIDEKMNLSFGKLIKTFDLLFEEHRLLLQSKTKLKDTIDHTILHIAHDSNFWVRDYNLRYALSELEFVKRSNYAAENYHKWFSAFKQHAFPYFGDVMNKLQYAFNIRSITNFSSYIIDKMKDLVDRSESKKITNQRRKINLRSSNSPDERSRFSFYTWRNNEKRLEISKILGGREVILVSDIRHGDFDHEAIKFSRVNLLFTTTSPDQQEKLNRELKNFDVKLIHLGDSKYKYGNYIYEMKNSPTNFTFNYDINYKDNDNHLTSGLSNGQYMLSPYATWIVKLEPVQKYRKFDSLMKFRDDVNLELIGNSEYTQSAYCDLKCAKTMQKYYTLAIEESNYIKRN